MFTDYSFASVLSSLHVLRLHKPMDRPFFPRGKLRLQRFGNYLGFYTTLYLEIPGRPHISLVEDSANTVSRAVRVRLTH